jgi:hypothetical protein
MKGKLNLAKYHSPSASKEEKADFFFFSFHYFFKEMGITKRNTNKRKRKR